MNYTTPPPPSVPLSDAPQGAQRDFHHDATSHSQPRPSTPTFHRTTLVFEESRADALFLQPGGPGADDARVGECYSLALHTLGL